MLDNDRENNFFFSRSPRSVVLFVGGVVFVFVVLMIVFYIRLVTVTQDLAVGVDNQLPSQAVSASASVSSSASASSESDNPADAYASLAEVRKALDSLSATSTCQGEADGKIYHALTVWAEKDNVWDAQSQAIKTSMTSMVEQCGETYAQTLITTLNGASIPDNLKELTSETLQFVGANVREAPEDAIEKASFSVPSKNIRCELGTSTVSCTIFTYSYESQTCKNQPVTYSMDSAGKLSQQCASTVTTSEVVSYETSVKSNGFVCSVDQEGNVECWAEKTGKGFKISSSEFNLF
ncbi:MAG: hypothetical protein J6M18_02115 [Actinomycetaceae bacterium]|nr:hypothetical protein [Actinomycetaceae bacterium]